MQRSSGRAGNRIQDPKGSVGIQGWGGVPRDPGDLWDLGMPKGDPRDLQDLGIPKGNP